ncbi:MAG: tail fiber domain-containing protein [Bacteroidetes bacterium]|nr:tail fiber domain-containing protein [Bacteroidota bacterium]
MKTIKLTFILICNLLFAISNLQAQAPEKINYQAVARNLTGNPLINQAVGLEFNIRQGSPTGAVVYSETHTGVSTNQFGLFTAEIGGGTVNSGIFSAINWGLSSFYLQITIDGNILPATQLLSVPFALYAKESANGPTGASGHNTLMNSTPEPAGTNCINGGYFIQTWLDLDDNGALSTGETPISYYVCNGTDGANGLPGTNGTNGVDGVSIDSTINNNDGTFSIYYSNGTSFTTSDLTGPAGTSGTTYFAGNGISLSGDTITNLGDADNNPTNELQTLSLQNDTLFLSNGNYVVLPTSSAGYWTSSNGTDINNSNIGKVGIGTATIPHQLTVVSTDTVIASFTGSNPYGSVIAVWGFNPNAVVGSVYLTGSDSGIVVMNPTQKTFQMTNTTPGGHTVLYADSTVALYGKVVGNIASDLIYNQTTRIYNEADTIYNYAQGNAIINVNSGLFLTDSLYVLGSNATNTNWVLANDGAGQAKWTDPSTIVGSVGDNWGTQTVNVDNTTIFGDGDGTPLSGFDGQYSSLTGAPTNVSAFANDVPYLTTFTEVDADTTNELQTLSFTSPNLSISGGNTVDLSTLSGTTYTAGTGINLTSDTITNTAPDQTVTINTTGAASVSGSYPNFTIAANANDTSATNEIQTLSLIGDTLSISGGNNVNLSTLSGTTYTAGAGINLTGDSITNTAPDQTVVITGGGTTSVTSAYPNFTITTTDNDTSATNEIQNLNNTISPGTVTIGITGGASTTFSIDDADANPSNELITSFGVNGTSDSLVIKEAGNDWSVPLSSLSTTANAWNLTGNALTNTATDFIGTIDNKSLNFRVFNQKAGKIDNGLYVAFFGFQAGNANTTGGNNNAFGTQAMFSNTTGGSNNAFGWAALYSNTGGQANTALGEEALYSTVSSNYNTGVGYEALYFSTGANNTGVGSFAGDNNITGSSNTFLGYNADANWDNLINATAIGANALVMTSNTVQLGAGADIDFDRALMPNGDPGTSGYLLSSQGAGVAPIWVDPSTISTSLWTDGGANTYLTSLTDNVGIGTNNPLSKLHIQGTSDPLEVVLENGGGAFKTGYSVRTGAGQSWFMGKELTPDFVIKDETVGQVRLQIATNGNVGIGTISPESMLHVALPNTANHKAFQLGHGNQPTLEWLFKVDEFSLFSIANENNGIEFTAMVIDANNGNVGIGTTTPSAKFEVENNTLMRSAHIKNLNPNNVNTLGLFVENNASGNGDKDGISVDVMNSGGTKNTGVTAYVSNGSQFNTAFSGIAYPGNSTVQTNFLEGRIIGGAGGAAQTYGVSISNQSSSSGDAYGGYFTNSNDVANNVFGVRADINGSPSANTRYGIYSNAMGGVTNYGGYFTAAGGTNNYAAIFDQGNVGIGTATPSVKLDVNGSIKNNDSIVSYGGANNWGYLKHRALTLSNSVSNNAAGSLFGGQNVSPQNYIQLAGIDNLGNMPLGLSVFDNGFVSINNLDPTQFLDVNGRIRMRIGAVNGYIPVSTADGTMIWTDPNSVGSGWKLTGNTGTTDSTHFIGTTDNVPLNFKVNGQKAGRIDASLSNSFYGYWAGRDNTTGSQNTAIGTNALILNTTGTQNTAIGASALSNNTGSYNTATGYFTLQNNTGTYNTATGHSALGSNTSGNQNTATGMSALYSNTTGSDNTASGQYALVSNINGNFNIATGKNALYSNISGSTNVATGTGALYNNTTGNSNTAHGHSALYSVTGAGTGNTALGYNAGFSGTAITTGTYNTFIGYNASSNSATRTNSIVIAGNGNLPLPADNSVRIGNSSMGSIGGQVGWTTVSDERVKVNVNEDVKGLAFIMKLKPVTYNYSIEKSNLLQGKTEDISDWKGKYDIEKMRFSGFLSQEVEKAAKESDYNFSGVDKPQDSEGMWGLRYAEFTVPLVKAVQEQQKMIEEQLKMIEELKKEVEVLKNKE